MNKKDLTERDICSKYIGPAIKRAGWDGMLQIREEVAFTNGRIIVRGKLVSGVKAKWADYILYYKPNLPIAIIEAKDNNHSVGDGMQQALDYAATRNIPFVFSSNFDGFVSTTARVSAPKKRIIFRWISFRLRRSCGISTEPGRTSRLNRNRSFSRTYYDDGSGKAPRYYQSNAVNAAIEAIAKGQNRVLLVMATVEGRPAPPFRSFGVCGKAAGKNASFSWPTATCWSI